MAIPNVSDWYIQDLDSHTLQTTKLSTTKKEKKKRIECSWVISVLASQVVVVIIIIFGW